MQASTPRVPWTDPADTRRRTASGWKVWHAAHEQALHEQARLDRLASIAFARSLAKAHSDAKHMDKLLTDAKREAKLSRANAKRARKAQRRLSNG